MSQQFDWTLSSFQPFDCRFIPVFFGLLRPVCPLLCRRSVSGVWKYAASSFTRVSECFSVPQKVSRSQRRQRSREERNRYYHRRHEHSLLTETEPARDVDGVLEKVQNGVEIVIEQNLRPVAVIKAPKAAGRASARMCLWISRRAAQRSYR
jgi:hypothetical protein